MKETIKELSDEAMAEVSGGYLVFDTQEENDAFDNEIHFGCGGHITGKMNPLTRCVCEKCGEKHYFYQEFFGHRK